MAEQYIFTIENLTKAYDKREVLKNIWLAFYPGAKIGVIGSNGAGKSTLLRIMAWQDKDFLGTARLTAGFTIGFVPQEPRLTPDKTVRGNIEEAVARHAGPARAARGARQQDGRGRRRTRLDKLMDGDGPGPGRRSTPPTPGTSTASSKSPWTPCGCRPATPRRARSPAANGGASPCARRCCRSPTCCCSTSRPTISTPRSVAWLERHLQEYTGTVVAVTHDRYFLDNVAQWILELDRGQGIPVEGQLLVLAGAEAGAAAQGREDRNRPGARPWRASSNGRRWPRGRGSPRARPASAAYEKLAAQEYEEREDELVLQIPPGPHLGDLVVRAEGVRKGYGDNLLMEDLNFDLPTRRHRRRHRPQRRRQDDAVPHDRRPGEARRRHAARRRHGAARLRRSEPRRPRRRTRRSSRRSPAAPIS